MCKRHGQITREFLGLRMRNFQTSLYMNTNIYGDFQICISVPLIDHEQLFMNCFYCIFISTHDLIYLIPMFSLFHDFSLCFSTTSSNTKSIKLTRASTFPQTNERTLRFFHLFGKKYYFYTEAKFS